MSPTARRRLGDHGERHARLRLEARGYRFVTANWRCAGGEIDLVMRDGDEIVFVEVKTRHGEGTGRAEEGVAPAQVRRLLAAAADFLGSHPELGDPVWRVDVVAITLDRDGVVRRLSHLVNALTED